MTSAPTIIRAGDPEEFGSDDPRRGKAVYQTRIDAAAGPTSGVVMGTLHMDAGNTEAPHAHNLPETAYLLSGGGTAVFEDHEAAVGAGDTVFVPAGVVHSWQAGEAGMTLLHVFPADRFDEVEYRWSEA